MTVSDLFQSSMQGLVRTKGRSVLTMLGISIGVLSVILVLSIGEAASTYILSQISSFGSDVLFVANGAEIEAKNSPIFLRETVTYTDAKALSALPWVTHHAAKLFQDDQAAAGGITTNSQIVGTEPDEMLFSDLTIQTGIFFSASAVASHAREAVIGSEVARALFGEDDPIGKTVKISSSAFKVIGVLQSSGTKAFQNIDRQTFIPVTAALDLYNKKFLMYISIKTSVPLSDAKERIRSRMRERHAIDNPEGDLSKDDFHVMTQDDFIRSAETITVILQILLISIAAISLLVGGIGIMNIMYVAVTERTHEIGLRKSIGARRQDILLQFLVEAVMQTGIGGMIGTILGVFFSWIGIRIISSFQPGWVFAVSPIGIFLGVSVSALIGICFGYFPARHAAAMHPIDALRFE